MLTEDICCRSVPEGIGITHPACDLRDDPPVGLASPGVSRNGRWREMRRSEFVTVPSFSPQAEAGSRICAPALIVSFEITLSDTTNRSSFASASRTARARGNDTAGLVAITHSALISAALDRLEHLNCFQAFAPQRHLVRSKIGRHDQSLQAQMPYARPTDWPARRPRGHP